MENLGIFIFVSTILYIDYKLYIRSGNALFFKDKSSLEKKQREYQELKLNKKISQFKKDNEDYQEWQ